MTVCVEAADNVTVNVNGALVVSFSVAVAFEIDNDGTAAYVARYVAAVPAATTACVCAPPSDHDPNS